MPQLSKAEQDRCLSLQGNGRTPGQISAILGVARGQRNPPVPAPDVTSVGRFLRGATHRRGVKETRGKKRLITPKKMRKMEKCRKDLLKKAKSEYEVTYEVVKSVARVKKSISIPTLHRAFKRTGVKWSHPREKAQRTKAQKEVREEECIVAFPSPQSQSGALNHVIRLEVDSSHSGSSSYSISDGETVDC